MDTGVIIAIVVGVLILLALLWFLGRKGRERRLDTRREQAREIRREAEVGRAQADKSRAEAEAQSAEARRQDALARERAASAEEQRQEARERHLEAAKKDPDVDPDEAAAEFDRQNPPATFGETGSTGETGTAGTTGTTRTTGTTGTTGTTDDQSVEHYERTADAGTERERRFERGPDGEVVRDEELEHPRTDR
jgi:F0F1-type ATP synthase membrane subunit b/b'